MLNVHSEIGTLRRIAIHAPDEGINHIPPRMMKTLLYDDIVDKERMCWEYYQDLEVLYWFLDPKTAKKIPTTDHLQTKQNVFDPSSPEYLASTCVVDLQYALACVLSSSESLKRTIVASVCGLERVGLHVVKELEKMNPTVLAKTLVSGLNPHPENGLEYLFPPLPNLIFTRDTGVVIGKHLLLTQLAERARARESLLSQYIAKYHLLTEAQEDSLLFLDPCAYSSDSEKRPTVEGGDVMMIAPRHLLVGLSTRTNTEAIEQLVRQVFKKKIVDKVSVISIPKARDFMHIDTVFTQIKRDLWVIFGPLSKRNAHLRKDRTITFSLNDDWQIPSISITQFRTLKDGSVETISIPYLEDLCEDISRHDFGCRKGANFLYCGGGQTPFDEREQWTDGCNFLTLKEGLIIGYDRNKKTTEDLKKNDFKVIKAQHFNKQMQQGSSIDDLITGDTLILLPSAELSRARGGSHCMSFPLVRDSWEHNS